MYAFVDRAVTSLDAGSRFMVWSMRSWTATLGHGPCPARVIAPAFARWKMISGLQPFHRMMVALNATALDVMQFSSLCCNRISEHEAIILELLVAMREGCPARVRDTLALLVAEDAIGDLLGALSLLSARMGDAGIAPQRPDNDRRNLTTGT